MKINTPKRGAIFNQVQVKTPPKSAHDMSFENKLTLKMGKLIPVLCKEVLPGEKFTIDTSALLRFNPLISPMMHKVDTYIHYFFVPNRLVWSNWEKFISPANGEEVMSSVDVYTPPVKPHINKQYLQYAFEDGDINTPKYFGTSSLADYLGVNFDFQSNVQRGQLPSLPTGQFLDNKDSFTFIDELPFRAYHLICDTYYRNEALEEPTLSENFASYDGQSYTGNQSNFDKLLSIRTRSWQKDYFTSCLPSPQIGNPVVLDGSDVNLTDNGNISLSVPLSDASGGSYIRVTGSSVDHSQDTYLFLGASEDGSIPDSPTSFKITKSDGSDFVVPSTALSINALRQASALQEFLELQGRAGTRYSESIRAHWGVIPSDARLQRPEYLGGGRQAVAVSPVEQTSQTSATSPLGNLAGSAVSVGSDFSCQYGEAEEHGFVIAILSVMPATSYQQGLQRMFTRQDTLDYAFPIFSHLGEQEVKTKELYATIYDYTNRSNGEKVESTNNDTFGYLPRYSEYKYNFDEVHGDFKRNLDFWHLGRIFLSPPTLNVAFTDCNPSTRVFAVIDEEEEEIQAYLWHDFRSIKPLPKWGTPKLL